MTEQMFTVPHTAQHTPENTETAIAPQPEEHLISAQPAPSPDEYETPEWDTAPDAPAWQYSASCAQTDPEAFYPDRGGSTRSAKRICMRCPVRIQCLDFALAHDERFGVWGGKSERERRRMKREGL